MPQVSDHFSVQVIAMPWPSIEQTELGHFRQKSAKVMMFIILHAYSLSECIKLWFFSQGGALHQIEPD